MVVWSSPPVSGLGDIVGLDATNKWLGETARAWGRPISMSPEVVQRVDELWRRLGIEGTVTPRP